MQSQLRVAILWFVLVFCYLIHGYYHLAELFFGVDIKVPDAKGAVPVSAHLFSVFIEILPLALGLLSLYKTAKWLQWVSFIFAILLGLLNLVHLGGTIAQEAGEIRQVVLLTFILVVNILLIRETNRQRKGIAVAG
jgi:hypothetical protein